ncbi:MAG: LiaI-LiaF-like domain-containing protein [Acidobacteriota bacterium]
MNSTDDPLRARERRSRAWRRAGRGLLVIAVGVCLLLNTGGWLEWSFWMELAALWPVALVALGIRLLFDRSRMPAAVLLSPLLILATMGWVAVRSPRAHAAVGRSVTLAVGRPPSLERWTLDGRIAYGELVVRSDPAAGAALVSGHAIGARTSDPVRSYAGDTSARVRFGERSRRQLITIGMPLVRWSRWELSIAEDLPLDVDLQMALADGDLDLSNIEIGDLELRGAMNAVAIHLGVPSRDVRIDLEGAFNHFTLHVPPSVPVRLRSDGLVNLADGTGGGSGPGYRVRLDGAFNQFDVKRDLAAAGTAQE